MDDLHLWEMLVALAELDLLSVAARAETVLVQTHGQTDSNCSRVAATGVQAIPFSASPHFQAVSLARFPQNAHWQE